MPGEPPCDEVSEGTWEFIWCVSPEPDTAQAAILAHAWAAISSRCGAQPEISAAWARIQGFVRVFNADGSVVLPDEWWGASALFGDWLAIAEQALQTDPELYLSHELLHLAGESHRIELVGAEGVESFKSWEETCSGGRSSNWSH